MSATGASPSYYDFDAFEEMTINTGGVDVTQQTGGVGINLVTKSGTDRFRGSSRLLRHERQHESQNITDAQRTRARRRATRFRTSRTTASRSAARSRRARRGSGAASASSSSTSASSASISRRATCQAFKNSATALAASIDDVNDCLNTDETLLQKTNLKAEVQLFKGNKLSVFNNFSKKVRNARGASDLNPIETTTPQDAVSPTDSASTGGRSGPNPTYKFGDQWVLSDQLLLDIQYAHVGNNFILDFHDPALATSSRRSSSQHRGSERPLGHAERVLPSVNSVNANMNYFVPGTMGGDHAFKFGGYWRDNYSYRQTTRGGFATARFPTAAELAARTIARRSPPAARWTYARRPVHLRPAEHRGVRAGHVSRTAA